MAIRELCLGGADVNEKSNDGNTPLHCAARAGMVDAVQELLERGADKTSRNGTYVTAAEIARLGKHRQIEKAIIDHRISSIQKN